MMNKKFIRMKKFNNCCFMPWGHLTMVKSHGVYFLTVVKMASSDMAAHLFKVIIQDGGEPLGCYF